MLIPVYLSIKQTGERYDVCRSFLYELIGDGRIEAIKDGRRIKVVTASADAYFASLPKAKIKPAKRTKAAAA